MNYAYARVSTYVSNSTLSNYLKGKITILNEIVERIEIKENYD